MIARKSKFGNVRSGKHASKRESRRAQALKFMELDGQISELREQVKYTLIPTQRDNAGKLIEKECYYRADFVYKANGIQIVEDTKGHRTADYIIKRKLMLQVHGIRILET